MPFLSWFAKGFALEKTKESMAELLPDIIRLCGDNFDAYAKGNVPILSLLPLGSVERALGGGPVAVDEGDTVHLCMSFPGLWQLSSAEGDRWHKKLTKALNGAPKYAGTILELSTDEIVGVVMEVVEEEHLEGVTKEWTRATVEDLKRRLAVYAE